MNSEWSHCSLIIFSTDWQFRCGLAYLSHLRQIKLPGFNRGKKSSITNPTALPVILLSCPLSRQDIVGILQVESWTQAPCCIDIGAALCHGSYADNNKPQFVNNQENTLLNVKRSTYCMCLLANLCAIHTKKERITRVATRSVPIVALLRLLHNTQLVIRRLYIICHWTLL